MRISNNGIALLKEFEGCKLEAYQDVAGVWTIGYGHTKGVQPGMKISRQEADDLLAQELDTYECAVERACREIPNQNQFSAMVVLAYNIGTGAFLKSSVLRLHNAGKFAEAASAFSMWNKAGGKIRAGLTRRRASEAALYLTPVADLPIVQTTSSATVESRDGRAVSPVTVMAGVGGGLTVAQQVVAQAADVWDGLSRFGLSPHVVMSILGAAALAGLAWFVWDARKRAQEGRS
jgi:lysozyme